MSVFNLIFQEKSDSLPSRAAAKYEERAPLLEFENYSRRIVKCFGSFWQFSKIQEFPATSMALNFNRSVWINSTHRGADLSCNFAPAILQYRPIRKR